VEIMGSAFRQGSSDDLTRLGVVGSRRRRALTADRIGPAAVYERGYEAMSDPAELRIAVRELRRVRAWIDQFAETATEMPDFALESVLGVKAAAAMVTLLIERAEGRLECVTGQATAAAGA
jgi:hypothetical protein